MPGQTPSQWPEILSAIATASAAIVAVVFGVINGHNRNVDNLRRDRAESDALATQARQVTVEFHGDLEIDPSVKRCIITNHSDSPIQQLTCWTRPEGEQGMGWATIVTEPLLAPRNSLHVKQLDPTMPFRIDVVATFSDARGYRWKVASGEQPIRIDKDERPI